MNCVIVPTCDLLFLHFRFLEAGEACPLCNNECNVGDLKLYSEIEVQKKLASNQS